MRTPCPIQATLRRGPAGIGWHGFGWHAFGWHAFGWHAFGWHAFGWHAFGWHAFGWHGFGWHGFGHGRGAAAPVAMPGGAPAPLPPFKPRAHAARSRA